MINVKIMYADESIQSQPIENVRLLGTVNVLIILVEDTEREGKSKNISMISDYDNYALLQMKKGGHNYVMLTGWDDDTYLWKRTEEYELPDGRVSVDIPTNFPHIVFRGVTVDDEAWEKAIKRFNKVL